jgi:hypothetical protein
MTTSMIGLYLLDLVDGHDAVIRSEPVSGYFLCQYLEGCRFPSFCVVPIERFEADFMLFASREEMDAWSKAAIESSDPPAVARLVPRTM